ncbi:NAD-dependent epimerase [Echinicola jeungdonensis]|uniref:NAD-dependent epimerase n=1 Tax=Echinicola jeungdonensis TaxID=709343 RepID=A0ABV5J445_9BACT|nr:NAD-dependent epimerase [Echinicola jeungdonensis]MDN3670086.1 NAD-dependent epimerase [Echinicola jeungdonensis]
MKFLVTGAAGFIGYSLIKQLLEKGESVVGIDSINNYYDVQLKYSRLSGLGICQSQIKPYQEIKSEKFKDFKFIQIKLEDEERLKELFKKEKFEVVLHMAAQAGVRYSITNPKAYIDANISGFLNVLEACRHHPVKHLVYASSSSVYGANTKMPFSTQDNVDHPVSLYAASKKANELMAHTYSYLYGIPSTGLRFFTVYGPWGRPDMALFLFTDAILKGKPIKVFNYGKMKRDFTYIDDIVNGVLKVAHLPPKGIKEQKIGKELATSSNAPYKVYNIGNSQSVLLMDFIKAIEKATGKEAELDMLPMQPGDVAASHADVEDLFEDVGYRPNTPIQQGINAFVEWFREYYKI